MTQPTHDQFDDLHRLFREVAEALQGNPTDPLRLVTLKILNAMHQHEYGGARRIFTAPGSLDATFIVHQVGDILAVAARNHLRALESIIRTTAEPLHPDHGVPQLFATLNRIAVLLTLRDPLLGLSIQLGMVQVAQYFGERDVESFLCRCYDTYYLLYTNATKARH